MEFVEWTEKYSTGHPLVDAYHHIFFQMVEEFGLALQQGDAVGMQDRIAFLVDYTFMHFDSEERVMAQAGYADLEAHRASHQHFRDQVNAIHRRYVDNPEGVQAEEVLSLVQDWFAHHILGEDLRFRNRLIRS